MTNSRIARIRAASCLGVWQPSTDADEAMSTYTKQNVITLVKTQTSQQASKRTREIAASLVPRRFRVAAELIQVRDNAA
jgi:hypothetical protein